MGLLVSILVLSFLIFFHELGHFLAARFFGVRVEVFSVGFGKAVFKKVVGDTEYRLSSIPLGGYVKMKGQDDSDPKKIDYSNDSYAMQAPWKRMIILFAGSFFNILLAFLLFWVVAMVGDRVLSPVVGEVSEGMPASRAGIKSGDKILSINNEKIKSWDEISPHIADSEGTISLLVERDGRYIDLFLEPKVGESKNIFGEDIKKKLIGIAPKGEIETVYRNPFEAVPYALTKTIEASKLIVLGLQKLIQGIVPVDQVGGVISIVQVTSSASAIGFGALLTLTALISVNLGILNLLPIPALDGGHIIFTLYEMVVGKKPNEDVLYRLTVIGWVLLFGVMFLGIYNDLNRIYQGSAMP